MSNFLYNFLYNFTVVESSSKIWATFVIYTKQPKLNNRPIGENSPNLVTLGCNHFYVSFPFSTKMQFFHLLAFENV
jgi:hypothetical protein